MAFNKSQQANLDSLATELNNSISTFGMGLNSTQRRLVLYLKKALGDLKLDNAGNIKNTIENVSLVQKISKQLYGSAVSKKYLSDLDSFINSFDLIKQLNDKYFTSLNIQYLPNKTLYKQLSNSLIDTTRFQLSQTGVWQNVMSSITNLLQKNITSGGNYDDFLLLLQKEVAGDAQTLGYVERYAKQLATDSIMQYNRQMQLTIAYDLGLEYYYYQGTVISDSRPFCKERAGKYFSQKEVESWASSSWEGKAKGTNKTTIFTLAGGYNCRHNIIPVSKNLVPKDVIDRQ